MKIDFFSISFVAVSALTCEFYMAKFMSYQEG